MYKLTFIKTKSFGYTQYYSAIDLPTDYHNIFEELHIITNNTTYLSMRDININSYKEFISNIPSDYQKYMSNLIYFSKLKGQWVSTMTTFNIRFSLMNHINIYFTKHIQFGSDLYNAIINYICDIYHVTYSKISVNNAIFKNKDNTLLINSLEKFSSSNYEDELSIFILPDNSLLYDLHNINKSESMIHPNNLFFMTNDQRISHQISFNKKSFTVTRIDQL